MSSQGVDRNITSATGRHVAEKRPLTSVKTRQEHIAQIAKRHTDSPLTTLNHHMDMLWMREAFSRLKKDSAVGVDGVSVQEYAINLEPKLADLLEEAKSGRYRPPPGKRVQIPKNEIFRYHPACSIKRDSSLESERFSHTAPDCQVASGGGVGRWYIHH